MAKLIISFLIVFMILTTFTSSLPLKEEKSIESIDKRQAPPGAIVYYAQFDPGFYPFDDIEEMGIQPITGHVTFSKLYNNETRIYGQCNTGLIDPDKSYYSFWIVPFPICPEYNERFDLTPELVYSLNIPGDSSFQYDFDKFYFEELYHWYFIVRYLGRTIGSAYIKTPGEP